MKNPYPIDHSSREYNSTNEIAQQITIEQGAGWTQVKLPEVERLKDKFILGAYVLKQTAAAKKKFYPNGHQLLAAEAVENAYLTLRKDGAPILDKTPLEQFLFDPSMQPPGTYKQLIRPGCFDMKESWIDINMDCLEAATEDLVIHWVFIDNKTCDNVKPC